MKNMFSARLVIESFDKAALDKALTNIGAGIEPDGVVHCSDRGVVQYEVPDDYFGDESRKAFNEQWPKDQATFSDDEDMAVIVSLLREGGCSAEEVVEGLVSERPHRDRQSIQAAVEDAVKTLDYIVAMNRARVKLENEIKERQEEAWEFDPRAPAPGVKGSDDAYLIRLSGDDWLMLEHYIAEWMGHVRQDELEVAVLERWIHNEDNPNQERPDWVNRDDEFVLEFIASDPALFAKWYPSDAHHTEVQS